jgi:uncharacterized membrane protein
MTGFLVPLPATRSESVSSKILLIYHNFYNLNLSFAIVYIHQKHTGRICMRRNFFICGLTGWCLEILFTSIGNCSRHDLRLIGQTSIWMFPIYGMACVIKPLYKYLKNLPVLFRGCIYSAGIFCFEYLSGSLLKKHHLCPWDYSKAPANINGVIRLDYAPVWMAAGLIFERILSK